MNVTLSGKIIADGTKDPEMRRVPVVSQVGSKHRQKCPFKTEAEGDKTHTQMVDRRRWKQKKAFEDVTLLALKWKKGP